MKGSAKVTKKPRPNSVTDYSPKPRTSGLNVRNVPGKSVDSVSSFDDGINET